MYKVIGYNGKQVKTYNLYSDMHDAYLYVDELKERSSIDSIELEELDNVSSKVVCSIKYKPCGGVWLPHYNRY